LFKTTISFLFYIAVLLGILLLLTLIGRNWSRGFALSDSSLYSLSLSSEDVLDPIDDLLTMEVYFSGDLPGGLSIPQRFLPVLLEGSGAPSDDIRFFFTYPGSHDGLVVAAWLDGIPPVLMLVVGDDQLGI
jgi:ABC-type uncharacterized transport system.